MYLIACMSMRSACASETRRIQRQRQTRYPTGLRIDRAAAPEAKNGPVQSERTRVCNRALIASLEAGGADASGF